MFTPPNAPAFFALVWDITRQIPPGKVSSYGQIASMIAPDAGLDAAQLRRLGPRWVGTAMRKTPRGLAIPWHRVINSQGGISFPAGSPQAQEQRQRLEQEGLIFDAHGKVDLKRYAWAGPDESFLLSRNLLPPKRLA